MSDSTMAGREMRPVGAPAFVATAGADGALPAVSWAAVFAGAAGAAALSLILLILGAGLGLSSVSPFTGQGASAQTFGASTIAWLTFIQLAAAGLGGYLAGRLRTRWVSTHTDEVYFRDTAHGFLAWAVATLLTAALLTSVIGSIVGVAASAASAVAGGAGTAAAYAAGPIAESTAKSLGADSGSQYFVDKLFRPEAAAASMPASAPASAPGGEATTSDGAQPAPGVGRIFASALAGGTLPQDDAQYLARMVAQKTGLSEADARKRVDDTYTAMKSRAEQAKTDAQQAAEQARRASAHASLWLFVALLVGAFVASLAATLGGRRRDLV